MPVYVVDKPLQLTSHDVVARARRTLKTRQVGHAGTLDPLASGVLTLLVGDDTKLSPFLTASPKRYLAWISFGATTPTLDSEGPLLPASATEEVSEIDGARIEAALPAFLKLAEQRPPQYSAVKQGGVKGYHAARRGEELEMPPRPAGYRSIELLDTASELAGLPHYFARTEEGWMPDPNGREAPLPAALAQLPSALFSLEVEAGTYIRAFARDLGEALGTGAFLSGLLRTGAGRVDLSQAVALERLAESRPLNPLDVLPYAQRRLTGEEARRVRLGQRLPLELPERTVLVDESGELVTIAESIEGRMKLLRVWPKK